MQVSIIIPLVNQIALARECLKSLRACIPAGVEHEIIIVDCISSDGVRDFLLEMSSSHIVLRNEQTRGYAVSINRAARLAQSRNLVLLDSDMIVTPGWLGPMLELAELPDCGLVGNIQVCATSGLHGHAGIIFQRDGFPISEPKPLTEIQAAGPVCTVTAVDASCCLVKREWFGLVGGFDEGYCNDFEDIDLSLRARENGFLNRIATHSMVRRQGPVSVERSAFEYRDASRFLSRWHPRTLALGREIALNSAMARADTEARRFFAPLSRRLGFGPAALRRQHRATIAAAQRARFKQTRPIRVGVDLMRLTPGGANGGVKPLLYSFLTEIGRQRGASINFAVFASENLRDELAPVLRPGDYILVPTGDTAFAVSRRTSTRWQPDGNLPDGTDAATGAGLDVLYAPFTVSRLRRPGLPTVSLVVDVLHRDLPAALSPEEVNFRHECFSDVAAGADYVQCLSRHGIGQMVHHYGLHPARCFHTYIPAQSRLLADRPAGTLPASIPAGPFFFYPANFWPHKNHEALLAAYRIYATAAGSRAWPLVLTGAADKRMDLVREMARGLGLDDRVIFPGHLDDSAFALLWAQAGALVFASLHEGFGIPLLEAMRFGVPIIATDLPVLHEVAGNAFLPVDSRDPQALAAALRHLAIHENLRADLAARGRSRLASFSLELEAGRLAHFLEAAARRQAP